MKSYYKSRGEELATRQEKASTWKTTNKQPVKKTKEVNGRNIPYMTMEVIDQAQVTENYHPSDFTLENLMEIGADKKMDVTYAQLSTLQTLDRLEEGAGKELDRMDAEEWAKKYIQPQQEQKNEKATKKDQEE